MKFLSEEKGKYLTKKLMTLIGKKVDYVEGKSLSANDFTDDLKSKLDGIDSGANKTMVDSALDSSSTNPVQNKVVNAALNLKAALKSPTFTGTPKAPTASAGTNTTQLATTAFVTSAVNNAVSGINFDSYVKTTDLVEVTEEEIDSWFMEG